MKFRYLYLCIMVLLPAMECQKIILQNFYDTKMDEFINVALYMTKRFISPKTNTLIIIEKCVFFCKEHHKYQTALFQKFLNNLNDTIAIQLPVAQAEHRAWEYNLFIVDSWAAFESLRIKIPNLKQERDFYFFILLTSHSDYFIAHNLNLILQLCQRFRVNNVVVMAKFSVNNYIGFYTYEMFGRRNCLTKLNVEEINRFEDGKLKNDFLFPKQMTNYFGCLLKVSARYYEPLLTFDGDRTNKTQLKDMQRLGGIEGEILKLLAQSLNFTFEMSFTKEKSTINLYLNSTGCFRHLENNAALIAIGGFSSNINNNHKFTKTITHHTTSFKFVGRSNVRFGSIKQLLNPLQKSTWIVLIVFLAISFLFVRVVTILKLSKVRNFVFGIKNKEPTFNLILTFLGYSMTNRALPKRNFARYILMLWLLFSLVIRAGYQGKMFDSLSVGQRRPLPKTINQLIASDYKFLSPFYTSFYPSNKTLIWKNHSTVFQQLQSSKDPLVAAAITDSLAYYNFKNPTSSLTLVDESIFSYHCVIYFEKNSILRESFERKIKLFTYSGITTFISKQYSYTVKTVNSPQSQHVGCITFKNLLGLYSVYLILCYISILIFILEVLTKKSQALKKIMDGLN